MSTFKTALLLSLSLGLGVAEAQTATPVRFRVTRTAEPAPLYGYRVLQWVIPNTWQLDCNIDPVTTQRPGTIRWESYAPGRVCESYQLTAWYDWNMQTTYTFQMEAQANDEDPYTPISDPGVVLPAWYFPPRPANIKVIPVLPAP